MGGRDRQRLQKSRFWFGGMPHEQANALWKKEQKLRALAIAGLGAIIRRKIGCSSIRGGSSEEPGSTFRRIDGQTRLRSFSNSTPNR